MANIFGGKKERQMCRNGPTCPFLKKGCCHFMHVGKAKDQPVAKEKYVKTSIVKLESLIESLVLKVGVLESVVATIANDVPEVAAVLRSNPKWEYLRSMNFSLDQIRRDLIRTTENK